MRQHTDSLDTTFDGDQIQEKHEHQHDDNLSLNKEKISRREAIKKLFLVGGVLALSPGILTAQNFSKEALEDLVQVARDNCAYTLSSGGVYDYDGKYVYQIYYKIPGQDLPDDTYTCTITKEEWKYYHRKKYGMNYSLSDKIKIAQETNDYCVDAKETPPNSGNFAYEVRYFIEGFESCGYPVPIDKAEYQSLYDAQIAFIKKSKEEVEDRQDMVEAEEMKELFENVAVGGILLTAAFALLAMYHSHRKRKEKALLEDIAKDTKGREKEEILSLLHKKLKEKDLDKKYIVAFIGDDAVLVPYDSDSIKKTK